MVKKLLDLLVVILFGILTVYISIKYYQFFPNGIDKDNLAQSVSDFIAYVSPKGRHSLVAMVLFQALQVVVAAIPGNISSIAIGAMYGIIPGFIISEIGVIIGTAISFYLSRYFGRNILEMFFSHEAILKGTRFLSERKRGDLVYLLFFIIPGFPKDFLPYYAGLTDINVYKFFAFSALGRMPGILISCYMGAALA